MVQNNCDNQGPNDLQCYHVFHVSQNRAGMDQTVCHRLKTGLQTLRFSFRGLGETLTLYHMHIFGLTSP